MKYLMITTILLLGLGCCCNSQHLSQAAQQYYTPPAPSTTATLGQAYNLQPQSIHQAAQYAQQSAAGQTIRVYGSPAGAGFAPATSHQGAPQTTIQLSSAGAHFASPASAAGAAQSQYLAAPQSLGQTAYGQTPIRVSHGSPAAIQSTVAAASAGLAAQPVAPSNYGWQVQHQAIQPQAAAAPAPAAGQYAAPVQRYATASAAAPAPAAAPVSPLHRPASVHYAQIGENLAGDYRFGYQTGDGNSFREETRLPDGTVQGQYGFIDADGKQRVVKYQAGVGGYQVLSGDGATPAAAPVARSAPPPAVSVPAIPQWAQSHIGGTIPAAVPQPQPQQQPQPAQLSNAGLRYASTAAAVAHQPQQHTTTLQLSSAGAQFAPSQSALHQPQQHTTTLQMSSAGAQFAPAAATHGGAAAGQTLTIRPIAAIAVRAGSSAGAYPGAGAAVAAAAPQTWGSHLG